MKLKKSFAQYGFTMVELLVVIALIGLLAGVVLALVNPITQFQKTRDAQRKNDLEQVQRALEQYYNDVGSYPLTSDSTNYYIKDSTNISYPWGTAWTPYASKLPKDPSSNERYVYSSTGQSYRLYTHLERGATDPQSCSGGNDCSGVATGGISQNACSSPGGSLSCNYGVSSSNVSP